MFRKFQEFTLKFFYDENVAAGVSHDDLGAIEVLYVLLIFAEVISTIACIINTCNDGFTNITTPWLAVSVTFWVTLIIACCVENKLNIPKKTKYEKLSLEQKRFIFKMSILLFIHLSSCGIMLLALPVMIIFGFFNIVTDGISKLIFPDPVKKKTSKDLSSQFDNIIKD
jgi:hypothetical protein